jgi:hypothetical protein
MNFSLETNRWSVFAVALLAAGACLAKAIRVFLLDPRNLGAPSGAAEDWMIGALVFSIIGEDVRRKKPVAEIGNDALAVFCAAVALLSAQDIVRELIFSHEAKLESSEAAFRAILGGAFLLAAWGLHTWQRWGRILSLLLAVTMAGGTIVLFSAIGFSWRLVATIAVLSSVFGWHFLPSVRARFLAGQSGQR